MPDPIAPSLCTTCRFNDLRRFLLAGKPAEGRGCRHHLASFPVTFACANYEREPGTDD